MKRKLLLVSLNPFFGGGEVYFVKLASLLCERYHVRAVAAESETCRRLRQLDVEVVELPPGASSSLFGRYFFTARELWRQLRGFRPDGVHLNGQAECYLASIPWCFRVPIITTRLVAFNRHIPAVRRLLVIANLYFITRVICISTLLLQQLASVTSSDKLSLLPLWLDYVPPLPDPAVEHPPGPFRILFVGRIEVIKGIFELIEAMRHLENVTLDVVGKGSVMDAARAAAVGLPITFHGFQADCAPYYRGADLLVFPSHPDLEGQGQVPFEAMAYGLPCLISDIDVALETADNGACAEVFPCGNSAELARKIAGLQSNPARLEELRRRGRARFLSTYTVDSIREPYFQLFDALVSAKAE